MIFEKNINIFTKIHFLMYRNHAINSANNTIDYVLDKGSQRLYDKYLTKKLPFHSHTLNNKTFHNNFSLYGVTQPVKEKIESVQFAVIKQVPIDTQAPKRISIKKQIDGFSTLSDKNKTFANSTKYQTVVHSQRSNIDKNQNVQNANDTIFLQQNFENTLVERKKDRPLTMQTQRGKQRQYNNVLLEEVEEKRAFTSHIRKRKSFVSNSQRKNELVKIKNQFTLEMQEQMQDMNSVRNNKLKDQEQDMKKEVERDNIRAYIKMKEKIALEKFEQLKKRFQGNSKQMYQVTNVQSVNGEIAINKKPKQQRPHIIHLEFNPQQEKIVKRDETKVMSVGSSKRKSILMEFSQSYTGEKEKLTNQQYTNNGKRQVSSIPFITLSHGIVLSERSLFQATASRGRPEEDISREQFVKENSFNRFKSHMVKSSQINSFATIDEHGKETNRSSLIYNTSSVEKKEFQTTRETKKEMESSILWRPRAKYQGKNIRISNQPTFNEEILDMKLEQ